MLLQTLFCSLPSHHTLQLFFALKLYRHRSNVQSYAIFIFSSPVPQFKPNHSLCASKFRKYTPQRASTLTGSRICRHIPHLSSVQVLQCKLYHPHPAAIVRNDTMQRGPTLARQPLRCPHHAQPTLTQGHLHVLNRSDRTFTFVLG